MSQDNHKLKMNTKGDINLCQTQFMLSASKLRETYEDFAHA